MHKICSHFATSSGFVHLVKQYPSSPHETLHIATNAILIRMEKTTRAAIGYNVRVANSNLRYNLRLPWRKKKKKKKKRNSSQFITRIASHPRKNKSTEFLFHLIPGECTVKKKIKLRNLFTAQLCISQLKPWSSRHSGECNSYPVLKDYLFPRAPGARNLLKVPHSGGIRTPDENEDNNSNRHRSSRTRFRSLKTPVSTINVSFFFWNRHLLRKLACENWPVQVDIVLGVNKNYMDLGIT